MLTTTAAVGLALSGTPALAGESGDDKALARAVSLRASDVEAGVKLKVSKEPLSKCLQGLTSGSTAQVTTDISSIAIGGVSIVTVYPSSKIASQTFTQIASPKLRACFAADAKAHETAADKFTSFTGAPVASAGKVGDQSRIYRFLYHYSENKKDGLILFDMAFVQRKRVVIFYEIASGIGKPDVPTEVKELKSMAARVS
jgi:hypothetical protein